MVSAQQTYVADKLSVFLGQYDVRGVRHWTVFHLVNVLPVVFLVIYKKPPHFNIHECIHVALTRFKGTHIFQRVQFPLALVAWSLCGGVVVFTLFLFTSLFISNLEFSTRRWK